MANSRESQLLQLPVEILLHVVEVLHDGDPRSARRLSFVSKSLRRLTLQVHYRSVKINIWCVDAVIRKLGFLRQHGLLPIVRELEVESQDPCWDNSDRRGGHGQAQIRRTEEALDVLASFFPEATGLVRVQWNACMYALPDSIVEDLRQRQPPGKTQLCVFASVRKLHPAHAHIEMELHNLVGCVSLQRLTILTAELDSTKGKKMMHDLKQILLTCPTLAHVGFCIEEANHSDSHHRTPSSFSSIFSSSSSSPPHQYCGLGFDGGEKPLCPWESLRLEKYPWADNDDYSSMLGTYSNPVSLREQRYWANNFDWSRLRRISGSRRCATGMMRVMEARLTALTEIDLPGFIIGSSLAAFLINIPSSLEKISVGNLSSVSFEGSLDPLLRHGRTLRHLRICHNGNSTLVGTAEALPQLPKGLPHLELFQLTLADPVSYGPLSEKVGRGTMPVGLPYSALDELARFPKLHRLQLGIGRDSWQQVGITTADEQRILSYLRNHASPDNPYLASSSISAFSLEASAVTIVWTE